MKFTGDFEVMVIADTVTSAPAYEYEDGKRTDRQKQTEDGKPVWSVRGVAPFVGGELVPDGSVQTVEPIEGMSAPAGTRFPVKGTFTPRPAQGGWSVTGTLVIDKWVETDRQQ